MSGIRRYQASLTISDGLSGNRMNEITDTSFKLKPENIDQALLWSLELVMERSMVCSRTLPYTQVESRMIENDLRGGELEVRVEGEVGVEGSDFEVAEYCVFTEFGEFEPGSPDGCSDSVLLLGLKGCMIAGRRAVRLVRGVVGDVGDRIEDISS